MTSLRPEPNLIIVLAQSKLWASIIRRHFADAKLSWVLDMEGLENEIINKEAIGAIIEIPVDQVDKYCLRLSQLENNSHNVKLFAIGDNGLAGWHPLLRAAGFSAWFWSPLQATPLTAAIERLRLTISPKTVSLETHFESHLPWANAVEDGFE